MNFIIRKLLPNELDKALELAWDTFLEFEAPDYGLKGVEEFKHSIIENEDFKKACLSGENRMWGAFDGNKLAGIFVMRGATHICLVFTHRDYHRMGVATAVFRTLLQDIRNEAPSVKELTLNSSPYGKPFYHKIGFVDTDSEKTVNGIRFTPMVYKL